MLLIRVLLDLLTHVRHVVRCVVLQLLRLVLFLQLADFFFFLGRFGTMLHFLNNCLFFSFKLAAIRSTTLDDDFCLLSTEEFAQISPLFLLVLEFLHDLVSNIIRLRRQHLRLIFLTVKLAHCLPLPLIQFGHFALPQFVFFHLCERLTFCYVGRVSNVIIHIVSQSLLL